MPNDEFTGAACLRDTQHAKTEGLGNGMKIARYPAASGGMMG